MTIGLACSLCALEFGKPLLVERTPEAHYTPEPDGILMPQTFPKKPKPKKVIDIEKLVKKPRETFKIVPDDAHVADDVDSVVIEPNDVDLLAMNVPEPKVIEPLIVHIPEVMPEFPGGEKGLFSFLSDEVRYPSMPRQEGIQGVVYVQFVVRKDGTVDKDNIEVLRSVHPHLDAEAIRAVKSMPEWKPGTQGGRPVAVYYKLPFRFKISP